MLVDTHCHLDASEFAEDRDAVVQAARESGVSGIVVPAVDTGNLAAVRACCMRHTGCFPAYGIHPLFIGRMTAEDLSRLRNWLLGELSGQLPPVAVGEIGLDFFVPGFDGPAQETFLLEQLKIARDFDLPVLLHVRRSVDQVLKCLRRVRVRGGVAHAFNGSQQQADEFVRLGFKLGFGGAMTYFGSTRIRRHAATLPMDSIVLETDAPDIPPSWLAGKRNTPAELAPIAQSLAELRRISVADVAMTTTQNAASVLRLPPVFRVGSG
jgi:TatD DNase family protein